MESIEHTLDPAGSLELIAEVITKTKENIREHSFLFLLWGWLIAVASFSFFVLCEYTSFRLFFLPFPILALTGIIVTFLYFGRKKYQSETYISHFLKILWQVLGVCFLLAVFINLVQTTPPFTYTMLIGGIGTLVSGMVLQFRPLIFGGILFLIFSVLSVFIVDEYKPLVHGLAIVTGYLIPGYLLKYSKI